MTRTQQDGSFRGARCRGRPYQRKTWRSAKAPDTLLSNEQALLESVDCWPMANPILKTLGGKPRLVAVFGRDEPTVSSSCGLYVAPNEGAWRRRYVCCGPACGELGGGNGITARVERRSLAPPQLAVNGARGEHLRWRAGPLGPASSRGCSPATTDSELLCPR